jgi:pimeloyl-ACP methyl ester carboxylesterase
MKGGRAKTRSGVEIYYETHGSGPVTLLLLHGWGGTGATWNAVLPHLDGKRFRVLIPDLRGHGRSDHPADGYDWDTFAADVLAVADEAGAARFVPVGFSFGGKLACCLAAKHPDRIPAQILVAPVAPAGVAFDRDAGLLICRQAGDWRNNQRVFRPWFGPAAPDEIVKDYCQFIAETPHDVLVATGEMSVWTSLESTIGLLELPTLLVTGRHDPIYHTAYQTEKMLPFLGAAQAVTLEGGHFLPLECPEELSACIAQFMQVGGG